MLSVICTVTIGEDRVIDHVVFVVHGIGPLAELSFRNLVDAGKQIVLE